MGKLHNREALSNHIEACENEIAEAESAGKRSIFAKGDSLKRKSENL